MFYLSLKHLFSRKRQTLLTLLGILLGSTGYVAISGFMLGFQDFLLDQLINNDAHIRVSAREDRVDPRRATEDLYPKKDTHVFWVTRPSGVRTEPRIYNPHEWEGFLKSDPRVEAYSLQFSTQVILTFGVISVSGKLIGSEPMHQLKVTNIAKYLKGVRFQDLASGGNRLIMGSGLLQKLGATEDSSVLISTGKGNSVPFRIIGVFSTGTKQIDDTTSFALLGDVQRLADQTDEINSIAIRMKDFKNAREIASDWQRLKDDQVQSWDVINESFLNVFSIQDATRYLMILVILVVAGFGIYNILTVILNQKRKEIAIMRAMGFEPKDVFMLFFYQGLILGFFGALFGCVFGYFASLALEGMSYGGGPMSGPGVKMPVSFDVFIYVKAFIFGLMTAVFATVLPAREAGKLTPIEIIRSGGD